jgi:hypothetical protein
MQILLTLLLALGPIWATGVISSDRGNAKRAPRAPARGGDVQVGVDVNNAEPPAREVARGSRVPGIYPVFEAGGRWMIVDRSPRRKHLLRRGGRVLVIGSRGVAPFRIARSTRTFGTACEDRRQVARTAYYLTSKRASSFKRVGTPVIAIRLKRGTRYNPKDAWFYRLKNAVQESTYQDLGATLKSSIADDLRSGDFQIKLNDKVGHDFARSPNPDKIQMKIDFGSKIRYRKFKDAFLLVEGAQVSNTYRRCMRLMGSNKPVGNCAEMPHELMVETRQLKFVAYDPSKRGAPFILAYTEGKPLWGHERWGFQMTDKGPKLFLRDAMDPKCRSGF